MSDESFRRAQANYDSMSPPEVDPKWEYAIEAAMESGDVVLEHAPSKLLALISDIAEGADFDAAVRELLRPLFFFKDRRSQELEALHRSLMNDDRSEYFQLTAEAFEKEYGR